MWLFPMVIKSILRYFLQLRKSCKHKGLIKFEMQNKLSSQTGKKSKIWINSQDKERTAERNDISDSSMVYYFCPLLIGGPPFIVHWSSWTLPKPVFLNILGSKSRLKTSFETKVSVKEICKSLVSLLCFNVCFLPF